MPKPAEISLDNWYLATVPQVSANASIAEIQAWHQNELKTWVLQPMQKSCPSISLRYLILSRHCGGQRLAGKRSKYM